MPVFIVLGAHRSGTSAVANVLHEAGIVMGTDRTFFPRANRENPRGFYENVEFRQINDAILRRNGYDVKAWNPSPVKVAHVPACQPWMDHLLRDYRTRYSDWGWKDPRQMLTLRAWHRTFQRHDLLPNIRLLLIYRNPLAVAQSMLHRGNVQSLSHGVALWQLYNSSALDALSLYRSCEVITVNYEAMVANPLRHLELLARWTGKDLLSPPARTAITRTLKRSTGSEVRDWPDPPVMETYSRLSTMANTL